MSGVMSNNNLEEQARNLKSEMALVRKNQRDPGDSRLCRITPDFTLYAEGSVLVETGDTKVICTASLEDRVPPFLRNTGQGWITAEYSMLPRATNTRAPREVTQGKRGGRTSEIQRLIGRSLRSAVDMSVIGENAIWIDCDVIQADAGTRTAAITGGFVAMVLALRKLGETHRFKSPPVAAHLAAVSVGLVEGVPCLDMDYSEDSKADVDLNLVMTETLQMIEIQGTAERDPFSREQLNAMLNLAEQGIAQRIAVQKEVLGGKLV